MKNSIFFFFLFICTVQSFAQITQTLVFNTRPPAAVNTWDGRNDVLTLIVNNTAVQGTAPTRSTKINAKIMDADGNTVGQTNKSLTPVKLIPNGSTTIRAAEVFDRNFFEYTGSYKNKINQTGRIPSGNYTFTIQLDSSAGNFSITQPITRTFLLAPIQLPMLILPADGSILPAEVAKAVITFRWTPVLPKPQENTKYRLQVFEVLNHQTPMQALRGNQPLLDKTVSNITQYIWSPQLAFNDSVATKFIWTIQSMDNQNNIIVGEVPNGEGRSEAKTFMVVPANAAERLGKRNNGL